MNSKTTEYESLLNELSLTDKIDYLTYWELLGIRPTYEIIELLRDILSDKVSREIGLQFVYRITGIS